MRVLIATGIYPPDIGGPATYSELLNKELPKRGVEVMILSFSWYRKYPKIIRHFIYFLKVLKFGKNCDLIYAQDPVSVGFPAALAAKILRKKFFLKIVGDYAWEQGTQRFGVRELLDEFLLKKYGLIINFLKRVEKFTANKADFIIVPSNYLASVVEAWGADKAKIRVVYNSVSVSTTPKFEARKILEVKNDEIILFSAGRDVPWKGFEMLRKINLPNTRMIIGTFPKDTYELWLSACDIFLLNTGYEGFSHQLLEAMYIGKPIVTTDAGGNKEIVDDGRNALIVPYNKSEEWKKAISMLLNDSELQRKLSDNAKITANKFVTKDMIGETIKVLKSVK